MPSESSVSDHLTLPSTKVLNAMLLMASPFSSSLILPPTPVNSIPVMPLPGLRYRCRRHSRQLAAACRWRHSTGPRRRSGFRCRTFRCTSHKVLNGGGGILAGVVVGKVAVIKLVFQAGGIRAIPGIAAHDGTGKARVARCAYKQRYRIQEAGIIQKLCAGSHCLCCLGGKSVSVLMHSPV